MVLLIFLVTYLSNPILLQLNMPALYRMADIAQVFIASALPYYYYYFDWFLLSFLSH